MELSVYLFGDCICRLAAHLTPFCSQEWVTLRPWHYLWGRGHEEFGCSETVLSQHILTIICCYGNILIYSYRSFNL